MADDIFRASFFGLDPDLTKDITKTPIPNSDDTDDDDAFDLDGINNDMDDYDNNNTPNNNDDDNITPNGNHQYVNPNIASVSAVPSSSSTATAAAAVVVVTNDNKQSIADQIPTTNNPVLDELIYIMISRFEHLVERGFLAPQFLNKMANDPQEILRFIRQNRAVVGDQLNRRLNPSIRPTPAQLEAKGIVPKGYFTSHKSAMKRKHRRKSSAAQDLENMLHLRPKPEDLVRKGVIAKQDMQQIIDLDDAKLDDDMDLQYSIQDAIKNKQKQQQQQQQQNQHRKSIDDDNKGPDDNKINDDNDDDDNKVDGSGDGMMQLQTVNSNIAATLAERIAINNNIVGGRLGSTYGPWQIAILSTLLFKTISEALRKSCLDTQSQEAIVLIEMEEMNNEMKLLRNALDKYFLNDEPDVLLFAAEEEMIRDKFHGIQKKLLIISVKQNKIHEKLRILHNVEKKMIELQNHYDQQLVRLRRSEEEILRDLRETRIRRNAAIRIRISEKSYSNWSMAKLSYTINIANNVNNINNNSEVQFINNLNVFLSSLNDISLHQNNIVDDFGYAIDGLEQRLLSIRHDMSKVRTNTFKRIYELHKQVEIAESLELGNRRLSVASATEIERERRHNNTKIQRQLTTLNNQINIFNYKMYEKNLREICDIQIIMSNRKLKSFFSVFTQTFAQTLCDIELSYNNLNALLFKQQDDPIVSSSDDDDEDFDIYYNKNKFKKNNKIYNQQQIENNKKIRDLIMGLYGIQNVLLKINNSKSKNNISIIEKIIHSQKIICIMKNALLYEFNKYHSQQQAKQNKNSNEFINIKIPTYRLNDIIIIIGRKLCINNYIIDEIDRSHDDQIPNLAQIKLNDIWTFFIQKYDNINKIFNNKPKSTMQCANYILKNVFDIDNNETNYYLD